MGVLAQYDWEGTGCSNERQIAFSLGCRLGPASAATDSERD